MSVTVTLPDLPPGVRELWDALLDLAEHVPPSCPWPLVGGQMVLLPHRYVRTTSGGREVRVDVLAPDGVGERADLTTTPPGRTLSVPGGTQALHRTTRVAVVHRGRTGTIPRPSLLGAIVGKGRACGLPGDTQRHHRDLALLCSLVEDPFEMREGMGRKDPAALRRGWALGRDTHPAWALVPEPRRAAGQIAFRVLSA